MLSRRRFIQAGTMASGAALATHPAFAEDKGAPVPPAIAGLKSMKDQDTPITRDERRDREEKARRLMQASNLDAILLMEGTSLSYFTGIQWHGGERLFAIVLPAKGMAFYVCPAFEEGARVNKSQTLGKVSRVTSACGRKMKVLISGLRRALRIAASPLDPSEWKKQCALSSPKGLPKLLVK